MKNFNHLLFLISGILIMSCSSARISKKDIKHSEILIGLEFTNAQIATMEDNINRNLSGFDSMRAKSLDYDVVPAIMFDLLPAGFTVPLEQHPITWRETVVSLPENKEDLAFFTVAQLGALLRTQRITATELTAIYLNRIKKFDGLLQAVVTTTEELAFKQAAIADQEIASGKYRGPLHGIPYGVKDLLAVEGYKTTWGAGPYKDQVINKTATVVKKLEEAGAILVAKLVSGSLARGDVWFGGKTKNPWDLTQGASGSSAGPGAATSAGLVAFSIGTETLGSIIAPSSRCGDTGLRPTYGRVSRHAVMSLAWSMDKVGPICRSAEDCAIIFEAIAGKDPLDRSTYEAAFNYSISNQPETMKVAYFKDLFDKDTTDTGRNNQTALKTLQAQGFELIPIVFPRTLSYSTFDIILRAEAGAFFDELVRSKRDTMLVEQNARSRANSLRQSRFIPAVEYLQANRHRRLLIESFYQLIKPYDAVLSPSFGSRQLLVTNLTGNPAISVPSGFDKKGRPTSFTIIGNLFDEADIITVAEVFQQATDFEDRHPEAFK